MTLFSFRPRKPGPGEIAILAQLEKLKTMTSQLLTDVQTLQADWTTFVTTTLPQIIQNAVAQANLDDATADTIVQAVDAAVKAQAPQAPGGTQANSGTVSA